MAEVDTSSYRQPEGKSALELAADFGNLHRIGQSIQIGDQVINKNKLDQANQALSYLSRAMAAIGPEGTKEQFLKAGQDTAKQFNIPPEMQKVWIDKVQAAPSSKAFYDEAVTQLASHSEMVGYHLGQPGTFDNGQTVQPTMTSPKFGIRSQGLPVQKQLPPGTPVNTPETGQPALLGAQPPQLAPGTVSRPPTLPVGPISGVQGQSNNFGGYVTGATAEPPSSPGGLPAQRPTGPATAPTPMFEEGKALYTKDLQMAAEKLRAIKPLEQALPLMNDIMSGPGTAQFTKAIAALKGFGIIPTNVNDPIVARQEVVKKLAQYVAGSPGSQRSDEAQNLAKQANANPDVQLLPALIKISKDNIALDRMDASTAGAFTKTVKNNKGETIEVPNTDFSKYGEHKSTHVAKMDERVFGMNHMEPAERKALVDKMGEQLKSKKSRERFEAERFFRSLKIVDRQGLINTSGE